MLAQLPVSDLKAAAGEQLTGGRRSASEGAGVSGFHAEHVWIMRAADTAACSRAQGEPGAWGRWLGRVYFYRFLIIKQRNTSLRRTRRWGFSTEWCSSPSWLTWWGKNHPAFHTPLRVPLLAVLWRWMWDTPHAATACFAL